MYHHQSKLKSKFKDWFQKNMSKIEKIDVLIIGAGLSGLTAATELKQQGLHVRILESRSRMGGRIHTLGADENKPIELGATWLGNQHVHLIKLLHSLDLEVFKQRIGGRAVFEPISTSPPYIVSVPESNAPSYRIKGGTYKLIKKLVEKLGEDNIILNQKVRTIDSEQDSIAVSTQNMTYYADKVISTIPPNLLVNSIICNPALPKSLIDIANATHTWMDDSIKVALTYKKPFWLEPNKSGTISSHVGPIHEMYDHSNYDNSFYSLMGFFNGSFHTQSREQRLAKVLRQLSKYYGQDANNYLSYEEKLWREDKDTYYPYNGFIVPHQNNGDKIYHASYMDGRLIISGTETSTMFPGYMEGAVYSGQQAASLVLDLAV